MAKTVDNPRKHICNKCSKGYLRSEHLKRHLLTHESKRPWECRGCGATFGRKDVMRRHMRKCANIPDVGRELALEAIPKNHAHNETNGTSDASASSDQSGLVTPSQSRDPYSYAIGLPDPRETLDHDREMKQHFFAEPTLPTAFNSHMTWETEPFGGVNLLNGIGVHGPEDNNQLSHLESRNSNPDSHEIPIDPLLAVDTTGGECRQATPT